MSANFSIASGTVIVTDTVDESTTEHAKVQVIVRNGKATLKTDRGKNVSVTEGVMSSERVDRNSWRVTFHDGTVWDVSRTKGGCRSCG